MAKLNYPRGVIALSSVEMWERFSFYTMQSLLVLYASAKVISGGLGWSDADALRLVGYYGALVYVSPVIGGVIADKDIRLALEKIATETGVDFLLPEISASTDNALMIAMAGYMNIIAGKVPSTDFKANGNLSL